MALTQLAPPYPIFTDKSGSPLDAGYLYFGEVNKNPETNPIQVYYDSAFTQPAAQPLRTSNGYVMRNGSPALIYADSQFSVTIRDKNNALVIYSPVGYGFTPGTVASFTDQMVYNEGSVGAVDRILTSRLQDRVSVKDFGAVGDGVTDDDAAVQAAVDYVGGLGGGTVYFPKGDYPCSISVTKPRITLLSGSGTIVRAHGSSAVVDVSDTGTEFTLDGLDVRGQTLADESTSNAGGTVNNTTALHSIRIYASGVTLRNFKTRGARFDGIYFNVDGEANAVIENFEIGSTARNPVSIISGINFSWARGSIYIDNLYTSAAGTGLYLFDHEPNNPSEQFQNCSFDDVLFVNAGTSADNWQVMFHKTNIDASNTLNVSFNRCRFIKGGSATVPATIRLADPGNPTFERIVINDCQFEDRVFSIAGATVHTVKNCSFSNIKLGSSNFTFGVSIGDFCYLANIKSTSGSLITSGATVNEVTLLNVMDHDNQLSKASVVKGDLSVTDGDFSVLGSSGSIVSTTLGSPATSKGSAVTVSKSLDVAHGTLGQTLLSITNVDTSRVAQVWEVIVNTQASGVASARRQRSEKIAFMITTASGNVPVIDVISGYGWADTLSSLPSGGDRDPGALNLSVTVSGGDVLVKADVTNTVSSGVNILNIYAVGTGTNMDPSGVS